MSQTVQLVGSPALLRLVRGLLWLIFAVAIIAGIATLVSGIVDLTSNLGSGLIQLTLVAGHSLPSLSEGASSHSFIVSQDNPAVDLTLRGMSAPTTALSIVSDIALVLTRTALAALAALLAWRLLRGHVFRRAVSLTVAMAGGVLVIGGVLSQAGNAIGGATAAIQLNAGAQVPWPIAGRFDPTLIVFGFVLLLVGLAFEFGERLQKDMEGLV